jgi:hypothetical protein
MTTQTTPYANAGSKQSTVGCGCGNKNCGGDCHCGSSSDASCGCNEGLLLQPHFFAGQLLTDDDLQALTNYTVTKNRLHNRYVVGSGVSCGLAITCHPCGNGKIIVQPGYAIDCCGNDIQVPCPVELDINAMVRDLKFKRLGHDCGDPCAEPMKSTYCEQPTDPITPYTQDESCATTCQPSRIREGFSFELRCPEEEDCPPSFIDRLRCCIGDLDEAELQSREVERSQRQLQRAGVAMRAINEQKKARFTQEDVDIIINVQQELAKNKLLFEPVPQGDEQAVIREKVVLTEAVLRRSLDNVQALGSAIWRYALTIEDKKNDQEIEWRDDNTQKLSKQITSGITLLKEVAPKIGERAAQFLISPIELATADAVVANTLFYMNQLAPGKSTESVQLQLKLIGVKPSFEAELYAYGVSSSAPLNKQYNITLTTFKNWLLRKMYQCPPTTECCLMEEVAAVVIPTESRLGEATIVAADALVRAFIRYLLDCICSALIPPCPTCEDPAVKLACLEIKDCKVDNICNMERTFLLTEHNLRYWLPFLHWFGEALEKICCDFSKWFDQPIRYYPKVKGDVSKTDQVRFNTNPEYFESGQQVYKSIADQPTYHSILSITGLSGDSVKPAINFSNSLGNIVARQPQLAGWFDPQDKVKATTDAGEKVLARVFEHPNAKAAIQVAAENQFNKFEKQLESSTAESMKSVEEIEKRNSTRIREVEADISKRLTSSGLSSTKVIKDLKKALDDQLKMNKSLITRLDKLEQDAKK